MEKPHQFDLFDEPPVESDEAIAHAAEFAVAESEKEASEQERVYEAMKEEGFRPDEKKPTAGRKRWLALGRKLRGEDEEKRKLL